MAERLGCDTKTIDNALQRVKRKILAHQKGREVLLWRSLRWSRLDRTGRPRPTVRRRGTTTPMSESEGAFARVKSVTAPPVTAGPTGEERIYLSAPDVGEAEELALLRAIRSGWTLASRCRVATR